MCGYNPIDDTAKVCLYDKSGEFRSIDIPFTHLLLAFISEQGWPQAYTYDERDRIFGFCDAMRKPVFLVKVVASREAPLDKRLIFRQIDDALNSASTYGEYVGDPMRNWTEGPGSYGLSAYRTCADFMAMCRAKRLPMDIRVTRLLFEHKSLMIERLEHLRRAGCNIHENVVQAYKGLLISTKALHLNMVASLKRGGDFDEGAVLSTMRNIEAIEADALRSLRTELV
jgi:YD repeat-containing protein